MVGLLIAMFAGIVALVELDAVAVSHWWERVLHRDTARRLRRALEPLSRSVVTSVHFHV
jgi:hypothetical protein